MGVTLIESAKHSGVMLDQGVAKVIAENSPILDRIKNMQFQGSAYTFSIESAIPPAQWRGVGQNYTRGSGATVKVTENVYIMGNEVYIDNFELKVHANKLDLKARKFSEISRSLALEYNSNFFEGDTHVNPLQFDGLRRRLSGNQVISAGTNGAALTLAMLDELIDTVVVPENKKLLYTNRWMRRKVTRLIRDATGSIVINFDSLDAYGKQVMKYNDVPILLVERTDDGSTILDFDETQGTDTTTASIYCVTFGDEEFVFGMLGAGGKLETEDLGTSEVSPGKIGRVEFYPGLGIKHPRCAGRLKGVDKS